MTLTKFLRTSAAALGALAVASATQANAADIYTGGAKEAPLYVPPPLWTGFYIGAHIGAGWESLSTNNFQFDDFCAWGTCGVAAYAPGLFHENNTNQADAFGGVQFGYNWQWTPTWVLGLEVDLGGMSLSDHLRSHTNTTYYDSAGNAYPGTAGWLDGESNGGFYGDVTGRLGWTWGPAMIYAKGGFAWLESNMNMRESVWDGNGTFCASPGWCEFSHNNNNDLTGWTIGGGVEWKVSPSWSIKAEYLHFEFDNFNTNCCNDFIAQASNGQLNNFNHNVTLDIDTVKLGFNYFWNPAPPAPLK